MNVKHILVALALAGTTSAALADDQAIELAQTGSGTFEASFVTAESVSGLFVDTFTFSLPFAFSGFIGSGSLTFASMSGPVSLVLATLDAANGGGVSSSPDADAIAFPSTLTFSGALAPLTLTVLGFAGDAFADPVALASGYGGTISFNAIAAPIPEPETYALMLAGLAAVGYACRRRRPTVGRRR